MSVSTHLKTIYRTKRYRDIAIMALSCIGFSYYLMYLFDIGASQIRLAIATLSVFVTAVAAAYWSRRLTISEHFNFLKLLAALLLLDLSAGIIYGSSVGLSENQNLMYSNPVLRLVGGIWLFIAISGGLITLLYFARSIWNRRRGPSNPDEVIESVLDDDS